jgi:CTD small phosphatase-like protein 2
MLTAGFSLLKSLGKSAAKRKRDGGEESPPGDPETDSATKRARMASAGGNPAGASFITSSVRKTKGKSSAPAADSVPRDLRDRFQSVDEEPPDAAGPSSRGRSSAALERTSSGVMGALFSPMFSFFGGGSKSKAKTKASAAAEAAGQRRGAADRRRASAEASRDERDEAFPRRATRGGNVSARTRPSRPARGALREPTPPSSDDDLSDDDRPIARLARRPAASLESDEAEEESDGALFAASAGERPAPIADGFGATETHMEDEYEYEDEMDEEDYDEEFDPWVFIGGLPPLATCVPENRPAILPRKSPVHKSKNTLVLDLDETLVHSNLEQTLTEADFSFPVNFNNQLHIVNVRKRPYLTEFMEFAARHFEVVVFTASQKVYAERLLNKIDPDSVLIEHRLYRDACVLVEGNYMKDLSVLGRDLSKTIIVDNSPQAFGFQVDNGVPIESWFDDEQDRQLLKLMPLLARLATANDVRPVLRNKFQLQERIRRAGERVVGGRTPGR